MKRVVSTDNWRSCLKGEYEMESIGEDVIFADGSLVPIMSGKPLVLDAALITVCIKGSVNGKINLAPHTVNGPCAMILLSGQVIEFEDVSGDFEGFFFILSDSFAGSLNLHVKFPLYASILSNPSLPLSEKHIDSATDYCKMMRKAIRMTDNPNRLEVARYITKAFFYSDGYYLHGLSGEPGGTRQEMLVNNFARLVEIHFKKHREIEFYAKELQRTPKYMSGLIKKQSGFYAGEWINNRVILEAKALMDSGKMTIQQISVELNFPSQSSFSKYFKRITGVSPTRYSDKE